MKRTAYSRRAFLRGIVGGAGIVCGLTLFSGIAGAAVRSVKHCIFKLKRGRHGCRRCEVMVKAMLKDHKKRQEVEKIFHNDAEVVFYTRKFSASTQVDNAGIAVGNCTRSIKNRCRTFVGGCSRQMTAEHIYRTICKSR